MAACSSPAKLSPSDDDSHNYDEFSIDDGTRDMTDEEMSEYVRAFKETEGFDMPSFPDTVAVSRIECITGHRLYTEENISEGSKIAINHYNRQNGTSFEFVKIVKANNQAARGILYYLTFEAKPRGTPRDFPTTTFQAWVLFFIDEVEVQLCRPKPST